MSWMTGIVRPSIAGSKQVRTSRGRGPMAHRSDGIGALRTPGHKGTPAQAPGNKSTYSARAATTPSSASSLFSIRQRLIFLASYCVAYLGPLAVTTRLYLLCYTQKQEAKRRVRWKQVAPL
jgi:hypothetical protein